jgi:hypothetical protein
MFVRASYRRIFTCALFVGSLAGTLTYAKATSVHERIPGGIRDQMTVLGNGSHAAGPSYSRKMNLGSASVYSDFSEDSVFDIFCSATDTRWLEPDENDSTPNLQRIRAAGSKPVTAVRRRYRLRPC